MKYIRSLFILTFAFLGIFTVGVGAQSFADNVKPARSIDDQVYHKVRSLNRYNTFDYITWQVNGSTVVLTGKVITLGTKREIANDVKRIEGVTNVVNNIQELPPSSFDDQIRRAALREFTSHGPAQYFGYPNPDVHIIVENGRITLEGFVSRKSDSDLMNILANTIPGVFGVTNNLIIGERPKY
jgi:hyperosmotically inducible protein